MDKKKWIDDVLASTDGMSKARPERDLFLGIEDKMQFRKKQVIPLKTVSLAAASIALLILVNILLVLGDKSTDNKRMFGKNDVDQVIEYYGLTETQLY